MNVEKKPSLLLELSIKILEKSYKIAKKKDDLENMLAISDRLMLLYGVLEETKDGKKEKRFGFNILDTGDEDE
jgi:hypothetical protein